MIYTSYFGNIGRIPSDFRLISIAGATPKWFNGERLPELAPRFWWWKEWRDRFHEDPESDDSKGFYEKMYQETVLDKLDFNNLLKKLGPGTACLLCYERPERFCHRHLVAKWLTSHGAECSEFRV